MVRLKGRLVDQELDRDRLAVRKNSFPVLECAPGITQELGATPQPLPVLSRCIGDRRQVRLAENLVGNLSAERLQQCNLRRVRLSRRPHLRNLEDRIRPILITKTY